MALETRCVPADIHNPPEEGNLFKRIEMYLNQLLCRTTSSVLGVLTEVTEWLIDQLFRTTSSMLGVLTEVTEWSMDLLVSQF